MTLLYAVPSNLSLLISFQLQCGSKIRKRALCVIIAFVLKKKKSFHTGKVIILGINTHESNSN